MVGGRDDRVGMSLLDVATEVRLDATRHLTALAGNASMCAIGRSGRSFPAAKYHEGRQAAAGQVRSLLRRTGTGAGPGSGAASGGGAVALSGAGAPGAASDAESAALAAVTSEWRERLDGAASKGPDWVAYASGGMDALAELAEHGRR
jgi:hypothetical protein